MPAYPNYKPSGVEWFSTVPEEWTSARLKTVARHWVSNVNKVASDGELPIRLCNYTDVYYHDRIYPDMGLMETTATSQEVLRFGLKIGDVLLTKDSEDWRDIAVPAIVVKTAADLVCGYHLAIVRANECDILGEYLVRVFQASAVNQQLQVQATGVTRYGLPKSSIGEVWIPVPSIAEQRGIANFLDRETTKLDTLVDKKRALIERLREKRMALISRTVTRGLPPHAARAAGLDPSPRMKPSGIDWLGDVPAHWEVLAFKRICSRVDVGIAEAATHAYTDDGVPIIRSTNVRPNDLDTTDVLQIEGWFAEKNRSKTLRAGDLVTVRTGYPGTTAVIPPEYDGSQCFTLVMSTVRTPHQPRYFSYLFNSDAGITYFEMHGWGTAQTNISVPIVQRLPVLVPPAAEQNEIVSFLDGETARLDQMVAKVEAAIERLKEYRSALVTAAVTGKIDMREAVA